MSPSEFDLRAALRDGDDERDGLDVDRIVAAGQARRGQRRTQLLTAAAAVVVVAGIGTGGAVLLGNDDSGAPQQAQPAFSSPAPNSASDAGSDAAGGQAGHATEPGPSSQAVAPPANRAPADDAGVACPSSFPRTLLPGGGSPGQFGSDGPMFAQPVASMVVCGYGNGSTSATTPARLVLTGDNATALAQSLENASKQVVRRKCPLIKPASRLAIIGVTADGQALRTVTTTPQPACEVRVTNGTAIRYGWQPPANLEQILTTLTPTRVSLPTNRPSGKNIGTPIHN